MPILFQIYIFSVRFNLCFNKESVSLNSFRRGGQTLNVTGTRLSSVANPLIQVTIVVERGIEQNTTSERSFEVKKVIDKTNVLLNIKLCIICLTIDFTIWTIKLSC